MYRNVQERLYLSQGDEETIFIDNCKVPQHHIDGIRFLYRQYKRKKHGVIINDPFSFGRNIQIIMFLKAVRRLLRKQVLVLCQEGSEKDWRDRFYTWTDFYDEVIIETNNPMVKKEVIINTMVNLHLFCAREWSIIIIDGDQVTAPNPILKLPFKADFKIWNTSINMKENLNRFEEVFKWIFPHEIFDKQYFIADQESAVDVIEKSILLDSFQEDIVLRRDDLNASFEKYQRDVVMPPPKSTAAITAIGPAVTSTATSGTTTATVAHTAPPLPTLTITKKNKDATGTKIKRSKPRIEAEAINKQFDPTVATTSKAIPETPTDKTFDTEDFSIENYKRKNKDNQETKKDKEFEIIEIDNMSNKSDIQLFYNPDSESKTEKLEEMDTLVFGHDTFICRVSDFRSLKRNSTDYDKKKTGPHGILSCKPVAEQRTHTLFTDRKKTSTVTSRKFYEASSSQDERDKKNDKKSILASRQEMEERESLDELNREMRELDTRDDYEITPKRQKIDISNVNQTSADRRESYELSKQTSDSGTKSNTDQVANSLKRINIDEQMKECEEKVSKKFKGSFLDSLF